MAQLLIDIDTRGTYKIKKLDKDLKTVEKTTQRAQSSFSALNTTIGTLVSAQTVKTLINYADTWTNIESKLKLVTTSTSQLNSVQDELYKVAQRSRQQMSDTVTLYTRLSRATEHLNISQEQRLRTTETINKALVVSGATTQEASSVITQLSQAMASGVLRGEEFNSISENGSEILKILGKSLGKTTGELRAMAKEGELTTEVVLKALAEGAEDVDENMSKMNKTIAQAGVELDNSFGRFIDRVNDASGASNWLAEQISYTAKGYDVLGAAIADTNISFYDIFESLAQAIDEQFGLIDANEQTTLSELMLQKQLENTTEAMKKEAEEAKKAKEVKSAAAIEEIQHNKKREDSLRQLADELGVYYGYVKDISQADEDITRLWLAQNDALETVNKTLEENTNIKVANKVATEELNESERIRDAIYANQSKGRSLPTSSAIPGQDPNKTYDKPHFPLGYRDLVGGMYSEDYERQQRKQFGMEPMQKDKDKSAQMENLFRLLFAGGKSDEEIAADKKAEAEELVEFQKKQAEELARLERINLDSLAEEKRIAEEEVIRRQEAYADTLDLVNDYVRDLGYSLQNISDSLSTDYFNRAVDILFGGGDQDLSFTQATANAQAAWNIFQSDTFNEEYLDNYNKRMNELIGTLNDFNDSSKYNSAAEQEFAKATALRQVEGFQEAQLSTKAVIDEQLVKLEAIRVATQGTETQTTLSKTIQDQIKNGTFNIASLTGTTNTLTGQSNNTLGSINSTNKANASVSRTSVAQGWGQVDTKSIYDYGPVGVENGELVFGRTYAGSEPVFGTIYTTSTTSGTDYGYQQGGYTGSFGVSEVAGVVHGQEYVVNASTTKDLGLNGSSGVFQQMNAKLDMLAHLYEINKTGKKQLTLSKDTNNLIAESA